MRLPWRVTFTVRGTPRPFVLIAQRKEGAAGPVSCSITFDGQVLSTSIQTGKYASPQCDA